MFEPEYLDQTRREINKLGEQYLLTWQGTRMVMRHAKFMAERSHDDAMKRRQGIIEEIFKK
jgi:hypothetical protein